jgi:septal ring factor EnvC (AmiA/AmiB activator)
VPVGNSLGDAEVFAPVTIPALVLVLALGQLFLPDSVPAQDVLQRELEGQRHRLEALQEEIAEHREKVQKVETEKGSVLQELRELDDKIARQWEVLQSTRKKWTEHELALVQAQKDYAEQVQALGGLKAQVELRLRALRELGTVGTFNILFAAESLPELLSRETYLKLILSHDREVRDHYRSRLKRLSEEEDRLEAQRVALMKTADQVELEGLHLEERKRAKTVFLEDLVAQGAQYREMLEELEAAEATLQDLIDRLVGQGTDEPGPAQASKNLYRFELQKGRLSPPVTGRIARPASRKEAGKKESPGVVFATPFGSKIRAVFDGTVLHCDVLPGYGRIMIIDHGDQYFSMVAQGAKFFKSVGERVTEGEIIGLTGGGPWIAEGIYFEIRHGSAQEDPVEWLDLRGIEKGKGM